MGSNFITSVTMKPLLVTVLLLVAGCAGTTAESTTTTSTAATTTSAAETTTTQTPIECPAAPYELGFLPAGVGTGLLDPDEIEMDVWTSVGGSQTDFLGREDGTVAIALIRGHSAPGRLAGREGRGLHRWHPRGGWAASRRKLGRRLVRGAR